MDDQRAGRIRELAAEYVQLVDLMRSGQYDGDEEWRRLSADRTLVHDELIALTGLTDRRQMYSFCRDVLAGRQRV